MQNYNILISSADVDKLKKKARKLKKDSGIAYHEALDQVAQAAGFNHWHHVSKSVKDFKPTEQAYYFGVIIAMDGKDAMDFHDPSGGFVEDPSAFALCAGDIYAYIRDDEDASGDESDYQKDRNEWVQDDMMMDYVFFRHTGSAVPEHINDIVTMVRKCSFWPPLFIWLKGTFHENPSDLAVDEDGKIVGIRF